MDESPEQEGVDGIAPDDLAVGELASISQDWKVVMQMLPAQWESKAVELGAMRRLRGFDSVASGNCQGSCRKSELIQAAIFVTSRSFSVVGFSGFR